VPSGRYDGRRISSSCRFRCRCADVVEYVALAKGKPDVKYIIPAKELPGISDFELFKRLAGIDVTAIGCIAAIRRWWPDYRRRAA